MSCCQVVCDLNELKGSGTATMMSSREFKGTSAKLTTTVPSTWLMVISVVFDIVDDDYYDMICWDDHIEMVKQMLR